MGRSGREQKTWLDTFSLRHLFTNISLFQMQANGNNAHFFRFIREKHIKYRNRRLLDILLQLNLKSKQRPPAYTKVSKSRHMSFGTGSEIHAVSTCTFICLLGSIQVKRPNNKSTNICLSWKILCRTLKSQMYSGYIPNPFPT